MKFLERYKWEKNPDGTYDIFDVPIFAFYNSDDKRGSVGAEESINILSNFQKEEALGFYPRIFIGHHNYLSKEKAFDNNVGAGFIDKLTEKDGTFYCSMAHVPKEVFQDIMDKKYPYRSAEYKPIAKKITGLALLASQEPYHKTPPLVLEDESIVHFCDNEDIVLFQKGNDMSEEKKVEERIKDDVIQDTPEETFTEDSSKEEKPLEEDKVESEENEKEEFSGTEEPKQDKMDSVIKMLEILVNALVEKTGSKPEEGTSDKSIETPPASSIAYQATEIERLESRVKELESGKQELSLAFQLENICKEKGINHEEQVVVFSSFSDNKGKENYLKTLKGLEVRNAIPEHFMSTMAKEGIRLFQASESQVAGIKEEYANSIDNDNAKKAISMYQAVMKSGDQDRIKMFNALSKDLKSFVDISVLAAKTDENYFSNLTIGE